MSLLSCGSRLCSEESKLNRLLSWRTFYLELGKKTHSPWSRVMQFMRLNCTPYSLIILSFLLLLQNLWITIADST
jgi:hypothetical protein